MPVMLTADEADARDRAAIRTMRLPEGYMVCPGYPLDHFCLAVIPWTRRYCRFCEGTRAAEMAAVVAKAPSIPSVGEIMQDAVAEIIEQCECGGDRNGYMHEATLFHMTWIARGQSR